MLKHLLEQRFFRLLSEYSQRKVSVSEFAEAIEELAIHLADFSINEQNYSVLLRYFPLVCIGSNRIVYNLSRGKNALLFIDEAIELIKTEVRIVNLHIKYPEQFEQHANKLSLSPLHLADKTSLINIMEIVSGLFLSKRIIYQNEKPVHLTDLGKAFEWLFNIKLGDYHQKYMDVIKRKPAKLTEFLNELANLIRKEHENKGYR
jgi:hypothetical protein